jgi:hypothetical protein
MINFARTPSGQVKIRADVTDETKTQHMHTKKKEKRTLLITSKTC